MAIDSETESRYASAYFHGLVISRDAWLDYINRDVELQVHHTDEHFVVASWNGREGVFCHHHGLVTTRRDDPDCVWKLGCIADTCCMGGALPEAVEEAASSESSAGDSSRRVIPRTTAAAVVAFWGLLATSLGKAWMDSLQPDSVFVAPPPGWLTFVARTLFTTGFAAVVIAGVLAVSCVFPWRRRRALCAAAVLCTGMAAVLFL